MDCKETSNIKSEWMVLGWVHMAQDLESDGTCENNSESVGYIRCSFF
jgi:hypothetical protein